MCMKINQLTEATTTIDSMVIRDVSNEHPEQPTQSTGIFLSK